jgi:hypothetical protein
LSERLSDLECGNDNQDSMATAEKGSQDYSPPTSAAELRSRYGVGERASSEAEITGANLEETNLTKADLSGANLTGAKGLTAKQIEAAIIDDKTQLPDYLSVIKKEPTASNQDGGK